MMNLDRIPMELSLSGVYLSPLLLASVLGVLTAWMITRILNRLDLARFVWYPPLFFLALTTWDIVHPVLQFSEMGLLFVINLAILAMIGMFLLRTLAAPPSD